MVSRLYVSSIWYYIETLLVWRLVLLHVCVRKRKKVFSVRVSMKKQPRVSACGLSWASRRLGLDREKIVKREAAYTFACLNLISKALWYFCLQLLSSIGLEQSWDNITTTYGTFSWLPWSQMVHHSFVAAALPCFFHLATNWKRSCTPSVVQNFHNIIVPHGRQLACRYLHSSSGCRLVRLDKIEIVAIFVLLHHGWIQASKERLSYLQRDGGSSVIVKGKVHWQREANFRHPGTFSIVILQ